MKDNRRKAAVEKIAILLAVLLAIGVTIVALYLLVVGQAVTIVHESSLTQSPPEPPQVVTVPYQPAVVPLFTALLLIVGLLTHKFLIAWIGLGILSVFSILYLFSGGAALLPVDILLLILLVIVSVTRRNLRVAT